MKNWRPDDWKNPYKDDVHLAAGVYDGLKREAYEAGADAMLESLASLVSEDGYISFEKEDGKVVAVYIDD